jgi:hypothetical protein
MLTPNQIQDFLVDLRDLCNKHRVYILGCGCHGSPWIEEYGKDSRTILAYTVDEGLNDLSADWSDREEQNEPTPTIVPLSKNLAKQLKPKEGTSSTD